MLAVIAIEFADFRSCKGANGRWNLTFQNAIFETVSALRTTAAISTEELRPLPNRFRKIRTTANAFNLQDLIFKCKTWNFAINFGKSALSIHAKNCRLLAIWTWKLIKIQNANFWKFIIHNSYQKERTVRTRWCQKLIVWMSQVKHKTKELSQRKSFEAISSFWRYDGETWQILSWDDLEHVANLPKFSSRLIASRRDITKTSELSLSVWELSIFGAAKSCAKKAPKFCLARINIFLEWKPWQKGHKSQVAFFLSPKNIDNFPEFNSSAAAKLKVKIIRKMGLEGHIVRFLFVRVRPFNYSHEEQFFKVALELKTCTVH